MKSASSPPEEEREKACGQFVKLPRLDHSSRPTCGAQRPGRQPVRAETPTLPAVCTDTQGPLRWRIEWASITDGKLAARFHAELERGELSESDTVRFQQQLRALLTGLSTDAAFAVPDQIVAH